MLQSRILDTASFFDAQGIPLTSLEIYKYLLASKDIIKSRIDQAYELTTLGEAVPAINIDTILVALDDLVASGQLDRRVGYYCLPGRASLISERMRGYVSGLVRWRRIRKVSLMLSFVPFVRGVGLNGSQAFGKEQTGSDIDLFVMTDENFLWSARTFVTVFLQSLGMRRHGSHVANRFCLNHYIAGIKKIQQGRNIYTALEYMKLIPLVNQQSISRFKQENLEWVSRFFPNTVRFSDYFLVGENISLFQKFLERCYEFIFGSTIESWLARWQMKRIRQEKYIVVATDELSFHPQSKEAQLLQVYFEKTV